MFTRLRKWLRRKFVTPNKHERRRGFFSYASAHALGQQRSLGDSPRCRRGGCCENEQVFKREDEES